MTEITTRDVEVVATDHEHLILVVEGREYRFPWAACSSRLRDATPQERACIDLSPGRYGIHWPLIDEDLAIGPLLAQTDEQPVDSPH